MARVATCQENINSASSSQALDTLKENATNTSLEFTFSQYSEKQREYVVAVLVQVVVLTLLQRNRPTDRKAGEIKYMVGAARVTD